MLAGNRLVKIVRAPALMDLTTSWEDIHYSVNHSKSYLLSNYWVLDTVPGGKGYGGQQNRKS